MTPPWVDSGTATTTGTGGDPSNPFLYVALGALAAIAIIAVIYTIYLHLKHRGDPEQDQVSEESDSEADKPEIDKIGLSKRAEDVLGEVIDDPGLQNELPDRLNVSKATVSQAISELKEKGLIKRKKKANTYLIEPYMEKIEEEA